MKYESEAAFQEIMLRGDRLRKRKEQAVTRGLGVCSAALAALVALCIGAVSQADLPGTGRSAYGAFLLTAEAGGYVLSAVLAFTAGVIITNLCVRYRTKRDDGQNEQEKERGSK